jgi:hypothetical protein
VDVNITAFLTVKLLTAHVIMDTNSTKMERNAISFTPVNVTT